MQMWFEFLFAIAILGWIVCFQRRMWRIGVSPGPIVSALRKHPALAILFSGVISLTACLSTGYFRGIAVPRIADEFCYLLAADTYLNGRLTNPPLPEWEHFEAHHMLAQPTRMSKYPPGQSLFLAVGRFFTGNAISGVWLSVAIAAAAVCWMLQAWVPVHWACLGAVCLGLQLATNYWGQSYWGGAVALTGGSLVFGAAARMAKVLDWKTSFAMGTGVVILMITRPYEGLIAVFIAAAGTIYSRRDDLARWFSKNAYLPDKTEIKDVLLQAVLPIGSVVAPALMWLAYNNLVVTGQWHTLPYKAHDAMYAACPTFLFQAAITIPTYHHSDMENYYLNWERSRYLRKSRFYGLNSSAATKVWIFLKFFVGPLFAIPVIFALWKFSAKGVRFAAGALMLALLAMTQTLYLHPHYLAPFMGFSILIAVQGWRAMKRLGPMGHNLCIATVSLAIAAPLIASATVSNPPMTRRAEVLSTVLKTPGKHLIFVQQGPDQDCHECWIYNDAALEKASVVWSRAVDPSSDDRVCQFFRDRIVWDLYIDRQTCKLTSRPHDSGGIGLTSR